MLLVVEEDVEVIVVGILLVLDDDVDETVVGIIEEVDEDVEEVEVVTGAILPDSWKPATNPSIGLICIPNLPPPVSKGMMF